MLNNISGPGEAMFAVVLLLVCLLVGAVPVVRLIHWWLDGGIEGGLALAALFLYAIAFVGITLLPMELALVLVALVAVSAAAIPVLGRLNEQHENTRLEEYKLQQYSLALEQNPLDAPARLGLAELLYKRGDLDQAIEHMEWTLRQYPGLALRIKPELESWKRERSRIGVEMPVFCHMCRAENPAGAERCSECGAAFGTRMGMLDRLRLEGGPRTVIRAWIVASSALMLGLFAFSLLPPPVAGVVILACVIVGGWLFLRWVGGDLGTVPDEAPAPDVRGRVR